MGSKEIWLTPCPYCGLHDDEYVEFWVCGVCLETGRVKIEDFMKGLNCLIEQEKFEKALEYIKSCREVDLPDMSFELSEEILDDDFKQNVE